MKTIEYRVQYTGSVHLRGKLLDAEHGGDNGASYEIVSVRALNINSGFAKALPLALRPLGNGARREIGAIEFWQIV